MYGISIQHWTTPILSNHNLLFISPLCPGYCCMWIFVSVLFFSFCFFYFDCCCLCYSVNIPHSNEAFLILWYQSLYYMLISFRVSMPHFFKFVRVVECGIIYVQYDPSSGALGQMRLSHTHKDTSQKLVNVCYGYEPTNNIRVYFIQKENSGSLLESVYGSITQMQQQQQQQQEWMSLSTFDS